MEKICIVKRRQQNTLNEIKATMPNGQTFNHNSERGQNNIVSNTSPLPQNDIVKEFNNESGHVISITMTNEQSSLLQSSDYIRDLLSGRMIDPSLYLNCNPDGKIIFNFCPHESPTVRMLRFDQVCQMLQISRSFLQKLVQNKILKSYKLGRLRRFAMEDILEYLISNEELEPNMDIN